MTHPPLTGAAYPIKVVPLPLTVTGTRCLLAKVNTTPTSTSLRGVITAQGKKEILLLSNDAAQQPRSDESTQRPSCLFKALVAVA